MKRYVYMLLALLMLLPLCACGGEVHYSAIPELMLSWEMSPDEVIKSSEFNYSLSENDGATILNTSVIYQKLPDLCGLPLWSCTILFDNDGNMKEIRLMYMATDFTFSRIAEAYTKQYGEPSVQALQLGNSHYDWFLDDGTVIEVLGTYIPPYQDTLKHVSFYAP